MQTPIFYVLYHHVYTMSFFINIYHHIQKSLKIPKGQSESYTSIEEEQTTQWPKEKVQKDKKRSTKYTHKTKNRVIRTPIKTMGEHSCSRRVSSSCSTSDTRRVHLVTNLVISHEWGKDREVFILWYRYSIAVNQVMVAIVKLSTLPKETLSSVASLLAATLYQGNPNRNHKYRGV